MTDTGIGIPADKHRLIFEPFEQVEGGNSRRYGGTGLGLAISSQLVALMGGQLQVQSPVAAGRGSRFYFTARFGLPQGPVAAAEPGEPGDLLDLPVLIVDDNATNRLILTEMLVSWRMKPVAVEDARQALEELHRAANAGEPYPLVLLDSQMPEMDGFALAEQIQNQPELVGATIMMLVSSDRQGSAERCREVGISACLMKPLKQSELLNTILDVLSTKEGRRTRSTASEPLEPPAAGVERRLRILLAEDNTVNQRLALRILEKRGHSIRVASNGKEALAALEHESFDLVLMDVEMPEMGGFEATALIRQREGRAGKRIPILALTAHAMKGDRERCLQAGMDGYVSKPIQARELYQAIAELLPASDSAETVVSAAVLDRAEALEHVGGDPELLRELSEVFLQDCPRMMEEARDALRTGDLLTLKRAAHSIKGAAGILGGKLVFETAMRLETIARQGDLSQAEPAWVALRQAVEQLQHALTALHSA